ncbi:MAG: hypothetical protein ABIY52_13985 [Gemmatimonadaceae bacterium]
MLHLVHEVLDAQLLDRHDQKIGRIDDLVLELGDDGRPRVSAVLIGGSPRARRMGSWIAALARLFGLRETGVSRVPFAAVRRIGDDVALDVEQGDLSSERLERWLREHVVCRVPGSAGERK